MVSSKSPMPHQVKQSRRHPFPKARDRVKNGGEYDQALQNRGSLTVWVTPEALADRVGSPPRRSRRGRRRPRAGADGLLSIRIWPSRPGTCCVWPLGDPGGKPKVYYVLW
jgi:hypothetical protein